jgi:flagellar hook-associated protein 2
MATDAITALGAGSGIDVKSLAKSLVEAERAPRKEAIDKKIAKYEAKISGYAAVKYVLSQFQVAFQALNNPVDFSAVTLSNSQTAAFAATASALASTGSHTVKVTTLANPQRSASEGYVDGDVVNSGTAFDLTLGGLGFPDVDGAAQTITVSTATPAGVVSAINAAGLGLTASLVATDSGNQIVVTGQTGTANAFTLSGGSMSFSTASDQVASDATLTVDGLSLTRSSNSVSDAITGVTLTLSTVTTSAATLSLSRDTSPVKTSIQALVSAYNDIHSVLMDAYNKDSKVTDYGATLVGDSTVQAIQTQVRSLVLSDSSTPSNSIAALRDLGVSIKSNGELSLDETTLDSVLASSYSDVVEMLSGNISATYVASSTDAGIAGDAIKTLTTMLSTSGAVLSQSVNSASRIDAYELELEKLETRMTLLLTQYTKQFSVMESIVGQTNSLRSSLTSSFDGMMATYTNN